MSNDRLKSGNDNTVGGGGVYPIADLKVMLEGMKWWAGLSDDVFFPMMYFDLTRNISLLYGEYVNCVFRVWKLK